MAKFIRKCWARAAGGCDGGGLTKEHIISNSVLDGGNFIIHAADVIDGQLSDRIVGNSSAVIRNLCEKHNNSLSDLDSEAARFFCSICDFVTKVEGSQYQIQQEDGTWIVDINGLRFERWLAKTYLNLLLNDMSVRPNKPDLIGLTSTALTDFIYGNVELEHPLGLYMVPPGSDYVYKSNPQDGKPTFALIDTEVELHKGGGGVSSGRYRVPCLLYFSTFGFQFLFNFNLTPLSNEDRNKILSDNQLREPNVQELWHRKEMFGLSKPGTDQFRPEGEPPQRIIKFHW